MMAESGSKQKGPVPLMLRVIKGGFAPANRYTAQVLNDRGYAPGDIVKAVISKINNPKFHRLIHHIGQLCVENIEAFALLDAHKALKRLQVEGNIACDEIGIPVEIALCLLKESIDRGDKLVMMRIPRSLSFDTMDDGERHEMALKFCRWIATNYWPNMTPEQIEEMAESFIQES
jgi:hypothetical protein